MEVDTVTGAGDQVANGGGGQGPGAPPCHAQRFSQNSDGWTVVKVNI